jgi:hypothetical protein
MIAVRFKKRKRSVICFQVAVAVCTGNGRIWHNQIILGALAHSNGSVYYIGQRFIGKTLFDQRLADPIGFLIGQFSTGFQVLLPGLLIIVILAE